MKTEDEIVKIPSLTYESIFGALGIERSKSQIEWERCRDRFQSKTELNPIDHFFFYHKTNTGENVVRFIRTFESACNCPADMAIKFKRTSNKNVLWIGISKWWAYKVRRSLLTALLRCGQNFTEDTGKGFAKALSSEYYTASTKAALEAFMEGRTACKMQKRYHFPGWANFFGGKNREQIDKCLVRLKKKKDDIASPPEAEPAKVEPVKPEDNV